MAIPVPSNTGSSYHIRASRSWGLEVILLLVVLILGYWFIVAPKRKVLSAAQSNLAVLQSQKDNLDGDTKTLNELIGQMKNDPAALVKLDEALPLNSRTTSLELLLNQFVQQTGLVAGDVSVTQVNQGVVVGDKDLLSNYYGVSRSLKVITGTMSVTGTIDQVQALLKKMETSGRLIDITALEINTGKDNTLSVRVQFQAYAYEQ